MSSSKASLVMVEDSPTQAARLKFQLEGQGYQVRVANRGEQAIELCQEEAPDLLITDVTMPGMDGYDVCRAIKSDDDLKAVPVMLLTGLSDPQDIIWGLEAGADCYLTKPYTDEELFNRIEFVLDNVSSEDTITEQETEPIEVSFLGQSHTITSTRKQMLNLLLSTYESAARRNEHLDKTQLKMKIDLKESQRRAEMAEASLTIAQAQLEESEDSWKDVVKAIPLPVFIYEDDELVCHSDAGAGRAGSFETLEDLNSSGLDIAKNEFEIAGVDYQVACLGGRGGPPAEAAPAPAPAAASEADSGEALSADLKRIFVEKVSAAIHSHLEEAKTHLNGGSSDELAKIKAALSKIATVDLLQWEAMSFHLEQKEMDLRDSVSRALDSYVLQGLAAAKGQTLSATELPSASLVGDPNRVEQALREVLENAIKYGPENAEIKVDLKEVEGQWEVAVQDTGDGPSEDIAAHAVEPFVAGVDGGLGLGLSFARQVCRSHGGDLSALSNDGYVVALRFGK